MLDDQLRQAQFPAMDQGPTRQDNSDSNVPAKAPERSVAERLLRYLPLMAAGNMLIALPALIISIGVAYFSFVQAEATDKMQVASVWPRVSYLTSNQTDTGEPQISLALVNKGVGPAVIRGLEIRYDGKSYVAFRQLLEDCCTDTPQDLAIGIGTINGEVLRPGEEMVFAMMRPEADSLAAYERFNSERLRLEVRTCYCSVFDDCWIADGQGLDPQPVGQCPSNWVQYTGYPQDGGELP